SDLLAGAEAQCPRYGDRAAEDQAVDMGVGETHPVRLEEILDEKFGAQSRRVVAFDVLRPCAIKHLHRHAACSSVSVCRSASETHRIDSACPYPVGWIGMSR